MKRIAWLLIAVVGTLLARVEPVTLPLAEEHACCCTGEAAGACGMPDCAPAPVQARCTQTLPAVASQRAEVRQQARARERVEYFVVRFASRPAVVADAGVSLTGTPAASVPLFKAHCSFRI